MNINDSLPVGYIVHTNDFQYTIKNVIGRGAYGIVYLAEMFSFKEQTACDVALKECFPKDCCKRLHDMRVSFLYKGYINAERYTDCFLKEYDVLSKIRHQNVVKVYELVSTNGTHYYSMEYLPGGTLLDRLKITNHFNLEYSVHLTKQLAYGLEAFHREGYIHSDLQLRNICFRNDNTVVLIDSESKSIEGVHFDKELEVWKLANVLLCLLSGEIYATSTEEIVPHTWQNVYTYTQTERMLSLAKEKGNITDNIEKTIRAAYNVDFYDVNDFVNALDESTLESTNDMNRGIQNGNDILNNNDPHLAEVLLGNMEDLHDCLISRKPITLERRGNCINNIVDWFLNIQKGFLLELRLPTPNEFYRYIKSHRIDSGTYLTFDSHKVQFYKTTIEKKGFLWHKRIVIFSEFKMDESWRGNEYKFYVACNYNHPIADTQSLDAYFGPVRRIFEIINPISLFGLCKVQQNGKWGIVNILNDNPMEIRCIYDNIEDVKIVNIPGPGLISPFSFFIGTVAHKGDIVEFYQLQALGHLELVTRLTKEELAKRAMYS